MTSALIRSRSAINCRNTNGVSVRRSRAAAAILGADVGVGVGLSFVTGGSADGTAGTDGERCEPG